MKPHNFLFSLLSVSIQLPQKHNSLWSSKSRLNLPSSGRLSSWNLCVLHSNNCSTMFTQFHMMMGTNEDILNLVNVAIKLLFCVKKVIQIIPTCWFYEVSSSTDRELSLFWEIMLIVLLILRNYTWNDQRIIAECRFSWISLCVSSFILFFHHLFF